MFKRCPRKGLSTLNVPTSFHNARDGLPKLNVYYHRLMKSRTEHAIAVVVRQPIFSTCKKDRVNNYNYSSEAIVRAFPQMFGLQVFEGKS